MAREWYKCVGKIYVVSSKLKEGKEVSRLEAAWIFQSVSFHLGPEILNQFNPAF